MTFKMFCADFWLSLSTMLGFTLSQASQTECDQRCRRRRRCQRRQKSVTIFFIVH